MKKTLDFLAISLILALLFGLLMFSIQAFSGNERPDTQADIAQQQNLEPPKPAQVLTVTATPLSPAKGSTLTITNLTRFDTDTYSCYPNFAPSKEVFLCYLSVEGVPQLWLASLANGLERLLIEELVHFKWADDDHILYSPWPEKPLSSTPQPVFIMNLSSGENLNIGQTTRGSRLQALPEKTIAFVEGDKLDVVKVGPTLMIEAQTSVSLAEEQPLPQSSPVAGETITPTRTYSQPDYSGYFDRDVVVSPDTQKVAVLNKTLLKRGTLTLIDLSSGQRTIVVEEIAGTEQSFSWSPDSTKLVYTVVPTDTRIPELWIMDVTRMDPPYLLWRNEGWGIFDYVTWLPDQENIFFGYISTGTHPYNRAVYQVINVNGGAPRELFVNGMSLHISNGGHHITFNREFVDGQLDPGVWIATLDYIK